MSSLNFMELCRLCLVKDRVQIPIFEGEGDIRQIFLKIAACLPIKVKKDDKLPKKICDDCMYKVEMLYQFWNTTANAEKQLLEWLGEAVEEKKTDTHVKAESIEQDSGSELAKSLSRVEAVLAEAREQESDNDNFAGESKPETDSDDEPLSSLEPTTFVNVGLNGSGTSGSRTQGEFLAPNAPSTSKTSTSSSAQVAASGISKQSRKRIKVTKKRPSASKTSRKPKQEKKESVEGLDKKPVIKEEPESDDDLPLAARTTEFSKQSSKTKKEGDANDVDYDEDEDEEEDDDDYIPDVEPVKISKKKRKVKIDFDHLREEMKKFGPEMVVKLEKMIEESQKVQDSKFNKNREKTECPLCGEKYFEILGHMEKHAQRPPHTCQICNKSFTFKGKLMDHKKFQHGISYHCEICNKRFNHRDNIRIHMATHETEEKYVCYVCGYSTKRKQCLEVHMMRHEDKWVCHCSVCNRGFFSYATLAQHMNSHTGEKPFTCDQCGANYSNYNTLWKHSRKFHPELYNNLFTCKICGKVFMKEKSYHIHMVNLHSKGNHFECDSCTKIFKKELSLIIHKRTHTNERPYSCKICGGAFTARKYLTKHMGVHKTKNYKCRFCYKKFMLEQALMTHERRHEEVR